MKKLITLHHSSEINALEPYVDGFIFGTGSLGARLAHPFEIDEIIQLLKAIQGIKKEAFIQANRMMMDHDIIRFKTFIEGLPMDLVTGVVVSDIGAVRVLKSLGYADKAVYNPETLLTNSYDFNGLASENIYGAYVAKEITYNDIIKISENKKIKLFMVGHGHLNMFYSKRQLIHNYETYNGINQALHGAFDLKIIEENRKDEAFPILEDEAGTHVFRSHVMHATHHLDDLDERLDYLVIDTIFKDEAYNLMIARIYDEPKIHQHLIENIQKTYDEHWDEGFFYKKTIYQQKG